MSSSAPRFKLLVVGDAGVGKTAFINRHRTGEFEKRYIATQGVEVNPLPFNTSVGQIVFNVWDTAGQERFSGLGEGYAIGSHAAIIFCDLTNSITFKSYGRLYQEVRKTCPNIPIVFVGNKVDCKDRRVTPNQMSNWLQQRRTMYPEEPFQYYDISAKSNYNFEKPYLYLARKLVGNPDLAFVEAPAVRPPEVSMVGGRVATTARATPSVSSTPPTDGHAKAVRQALARAAIQRAQRELQLALNELQRLEDE